MIFQRPYIIFDDHYISKTIMLHELWHFSISCIKKVFLNDKVYHNILEWSLSISLVLFPWWFQVGKMTWRVSAWEIEIALNIQFSWRRFSPFFGIIYWFINTLAINLHWAMNQGFLSYMNKIKHMFKISMNYLFQHWFLQPIVVDS